MKVYKDLSKENKKIFNGIDELLSELSKKSKRQILDLLLFKYL